MERQLLRTILAALTIGMMATLAQAATLDPFYVNLYQRGVAHFDAGDYAAANRELRIAAFGFVDALEQFETAHIYAAVAAGRIANADDQRAHVQRVLAAERIARTYAALPLAAPIRGQFEDAARTSLSAADLNFLHGAAPPEMGASSSPQASAAPASTPTPTPAPPPAPAPTPARVATQPAAPPIAQPRPAMPVPARPQPPTPKPAVTATQPQPQRVITPQQPPKPLVVPPPQPVRSEPRVSGTLADAERAVANGDLPSARAIFRAQLAAGQLPHATALQIGAGLYRSRDFAGAVQAFARAGTLAAGEEPYHYYYAVALYETGQYAAAKQELAAALPYIEPTPDVDRYRAKIEGAIS
jgi:tetratricopeptide (TPR) repeat protein